MRSRRMVSPDTLSAAESSEARKVGAASSCARIRWCRNAFESRSGSCARDAGGWVTDATSDGAWVGIGSRFTICPSSGSDVLGSQRVAHLLKLARGARRCRHLHAPQSPVLAPLYLRLRPSPAIYRSSAGLTQTASRNEGAKSASKESALNLPLAARILSCPAVSGADFALRSKRRRGRLVSRGDMP